MYDLHELGVLISKLQVSVDEIKKKMAPAEPDRYSSVENKELLSALAIAQGNFKRATYNRKTNYYASPYADLSMLREATQSALAANGLSYVDQLRINEDGQTILHSILSHSSGQWVESRIRVVPPKNDSQSFESTLMNLRRNAYKCLLGITVVNDPSDDAGDYAMAEARELMAKGVDKTLSYTPKAESFETVSRDQIDSMEYELDEYPDIAQQILEGMKVKSLADLPKSTYQKTMDRIRELKDIRRNLKRGK